MKQILKFDAWAGGIGGVVMIATAGLWAHFLGLDPALIRGTGVVNLCYCVYATSLARQDVAVPKGTSIPIGANALWALVCFVLAGVRLADAPLGAVYFAAEGIFVGALAGAEARVLRRCRAS